MSSYRTEGWPDYRLVPYDFLESLYSGESCDFDHHGGCQAHMYLSLEPGEICPQELLRRVLGK